MAEAKTIPDQNGGVELTDVASGDLIPVVDVSDSNKVKPTTADNLVGDRLNAGTLPASVTTLAASGDITLNSGRLSIFSHETGLVSGVSTGMVYCTTSAFDGVNGSVVLQSRPVAGAKAYVVTGATPAVATEWDDSGNATFSGHANSPTFRATGIGVATSGVGTEILYSTSGGNGIVQAYDRSTSSHKPLNIAGLGVVTTIKGGLQVDEVYNSGTFSTSGASAGTQINASASVKQINQSTTVSSSVTHHGFYNTNGNVGSISTNGSATSFNTSSDPRLKSEFVSLDDQAAAQMVVEAVENKWVGVFTFKSDMSTPIAGYNAHALIDHQPTFGGTEGEGPRHAELGSVYREAVIKQRPKMIPETKPILDEDGNPTGREELTGQLIESGEFEDYEAEPEKVVTPAGVDQSKRVPLLEAALYNALKRIEALEAAR